MFEVTIRELELALHGVDLILAFAESVPFIRIIMSFDRLAGVLQHFDHLLRFFFRYSDIIVTLGN